MTNDTSMSGQVAVVTGAGGGIGSAISRRLAKAGAQVVLTYRQSREKTQAVADSLSGEGHLVVQAPVDDSTAVKRLVDEVDGRYRKVHLLVNCAGITRPVAHDDLDGLDDELIDQIFRVNWRGAFAMIRAFRPLLEKDEGGTVINISSISGVTAVGSNVAYCASKAAMNSMTMSLARALAPKIRVVSVSPGWVLGEYASRVDPAYLQEQIEKTPLGRLANAEDAAEAVWAVATQLTFTNGCIVPVDGGRPLL
jgi:3-oxoacyl-[acyl-carrier protein] reductase